MSTRRSGTMQHALSQPQRVSARDPRLTSEYYAALVTTVSQGAAIHELEAAEPLSRTLQQATEALQQHVKAAREAVSHARSITAPPPQPQRISTDLARASYLANAAASSTDFMD